MHWTSMMSKCEKTGTGAVNRSTVQEQASMSCSSSLPLHRILSCSCLLLLFLLSGCRRDMQDQPKMKPYRETAFFSDRLSSRPPIEGTIPRGFLRSDTAFYTGKKTASTGGSQTGSSQGQGQQQGQAQNQASSQGGSQGGSQEGSQAGSQAGAQANAYPDDVETFPFPVTKEIVMRGRERYDIFCSVCHGLTGNGDGMIVRRGFRRAASFNDDRLRQAPVGHFFDAITNGWGAMPPYAAQIAVQDRWAIIAYIRALQTSQSNPAAASASPSPSPAASPAPTTGGRE
jgi:mono/diheme cytochrome c family protein